jgi:hypothetical protein
MILFFENFQNTELLLHDKIYPIKWTMLPSLYSNISSPMNYSSSKMRHQRSGPFCEAAVLACIGHLFISSPPPIALSPRLPPPIPICPGIRGLSPDGRTRLSSSHWLKLIGGHFGKGRPSLRRLFAGSFCRQWHMPSRCIMARCIMGKLMAQSSCVGGAWQKKGYLLGRGLGY